MRIPRYLIIPLVIASAFTLLSGCTPKGENIRKETFASLVESVEPEYMTEWPENEYTKYIFRPEYGEMDHVLDYSGSGRYAVWIKDITKAQSEEYVKALQEHGFLTDHSKKNSVSAGTVLKKDNIVLSISYSGTDLGVLITVEN